MRTSILVCVVLLLSTSGHAECPTADLTDDCFVGLADLAVLAGQWEGEPNMPLLYDMASQWGTEGIRDIVFVDIPGGTFEMGDHHDGLPEAPPHTVTLSTFRISKYETTNAQYAEYLNAANAQGLIKVSGGIVYAVSDDPNSQPYMDTHSANSNSNSQIDYTGTFTVRRKSGRDMSNDPVLEVSWYGSQAFCDYYGYRLPTEAEWEYVARGGEHNPYYRFPWGNTITHSQANYKSSSNSYDVSPTRGFHPSYNDGVYPYTSPVGSFAANGYGLHDTAGNVWEWCHDWYDVSYYYIGPQQDPQGPGSGSYRVVRCGGWNYHAYTCRSAFRTTYVPVGRLSHVGFRCALDFQ